jgi:uncharacterized protein (UPF0335 family)
MTNLKINIPEELDKMFREIAMKRYGYTKGALSLAAERALSEWVLKIERSEKAKAIIKKHAKDPVDELEGLLSHVKGKTSVQLQHEAMEIWAEEAMRYRKK